MEFDPDAKFGFEIQVGNEIPAYVTVEELEEIIKQKEYQTEIDDYLLNLRKSERTGLLYTHLSFFLHPHWIASHILVEKCMQHPELYDWAEITDMYNFARIAEIVYVWMNPFIWIPRDDIHLQDCIILGKVATQKYDKSRNEQFIYDWLSQMYRERALFIADYRPKSEKDQQTNDGHKVLKGMIPWDLLITDGRQYIKDIIEDEINLEHDKGEFNPESFRENLQYIAEERSPQVAAELLRKLRKDWPSIVAWKCFGIDKISPEQVEKFRSCLFEGMDYYLEQWEAVNTEEVTAASKPTCFPLITQECKKAGKVDSVEAEIRAACHGTAVGLWKILRTNDALNYIEPLEPWNAADLYRTISNYFGVLPFKERNFREARNKK